jgi:catechol 2,3-dioxygenase-like lactoylglutathione lyase family enzyme
MIHHVSIGTNDVHRARKFYDPLMALIGFRVLKSSDQSVHYGASDIVFSLKTLVNGELSGPGNGVHIAFQAPDREIVRRFHATAVTSGGSDEGPQASVKNATLTTMGPSRAISTATRSKP